MAQHVTDDARRGRLRLPRTEPGAAAVPAGRRTVRVGGRPVGLLFGPAMPARRLVVLLHGAGGDAEQGLRLLIGEADEQRLTLFAPQSVGRTWDVIEGGYGPDVVRIQHALVEILTTYRLSPPILGIGGFSDGASYALSLGLTNGDLFDAVIAFSPGFAAPTSHADRPACFVSHGRFDTVLPIDRCSRRLVPALRRAGYPVHYREFDGGHEVPSEIVDEAVRWLADTGSAGRTLS